MDEWPAASCGERKIFSAEGLTKNLPGRVQRRAQATPPQRPVSLRSSRGPSGLPVTRLRRSTSQTHDTAESHGSLSSSRHLACRLYTVRSGGRLSSRYEPEEHDAEKKHGVRKNKENGRAVGSRNK